MTTPLPPIEFKPCGTWIGKEAAKSGSRTRDVDEINGAAVGLLPRFKLVPFDKIPLDTTPAYLVRNIIPREGLIIVWGPPKCGKSFWTFDLALHVSLGWEYRGRRVNQGSVVYIACEGERGIGARAEAFRRNRLAEDASVPKFHLLATRLDLVADNQELIADIRAQLGEEVPAVIVIDTLNRSIVGSESSDEDMGAYIKAADAVREAFRCAVIIVHHCGINDSRPRGHTSLTGAADGQISIRRENGLVVAKVEWLKDGAEGEKVHSRLEVVELGEDSDGEQITSCLVEPTDGEQPSKRPMPLSPRQRLAIQVLRDCLADNGEASPEGLNYPTGGQVVHKDIWRDALLNAGVIDREGANPRADFKRLRLGLLDRGVIGMWDDRIWPSG